MPVMPSARRSALLALALAAAAALAPAARAQLAYTEPPDLSSDPFSAPTLIGAVAAGGAGGAGGAGSVNTVTGTISGSWESSGAASGDPLDLFTFVVPDGLAVVGIQLVVSDYACASCSDSIFSPSPSIGTVPVTGNGTFTVPTAGPLFPGLYSIGVFASGVGTAGSSSFSYQIRITAGPTNNDTCQFATPIGLGATAFNNVAATTDGLRHLGACNFFNGAGIAKDLWYTFTPAAAGTLTVSTCGSGGGAFDTEVNVYGSPACPGTDATLLACNDDNAAACGAGSSQSQVVVAASAGQTYLIRVGSYDGNPVAGVGTLTLSQVTTGACCSRRTGGCLVLTPADCQTMGNVFLGFGSACSPNPCVACPGDFDGSGVKEVADIFAFLSAWFAPCP